MALQRKGIEQQLKTTNVCTEEKVSRRLTLCLFPNICVCFLASPRKPQRFTEGKSSVVILTNLRFHGLKMFSRSAPVSLCLSAW